MSEEKKVMCHAFLVSYHHGRGYGKVINYREIGKATARPSAADLESILDYVCEQAGINRAMCLVLSVSELQDEMVPLNKLGYHEEEPQQ